MGYLKSQNFRFAIGTDITPATLTVDFSGNQAIRDVRSYNQMSVYIEYTPAEGSPAELVMQFETGPDDANLFSKVAFLDGATAGETEMKPHIYFLTSTGASVTLKRRFFFDLADDKVRLSVRERNVSSTFGTARVAIQRNEENG